MVIVPFICYLMYLPCSVEYLLTSHESALLLRQSSLVTKDVWHQLGLPRISCPRTDIQGGRQDIQGGLWKEVRRRGL